MVFEDHKRVKVTTTDGKNYKGRFTIIDEKLFQSTIY